MIEEAMVDPNATISLDRSAYHDLVICLSRYDEFLSHLNETTLDVTDDLREIVGAEECCYGEVDADDQIEALDEEEEDIF
jgi:hypothetical protein